MKIKSIIYALMALGVAVSATSCRNDGNDPVTPAEGQELVLLPSIGKMQEEVITLRSGGSNSFFEDGDKITVKITTSREAKSSHEYTYGGSTFTGGFKFTPDNTYIKELEALWPAEDSEGRTQVITDQRKYVDYKQANRLKAVGSTKNIMPTAAPVPLVFQHEQSRITFRLAGQNANGLIIKSLLLELDTKLPGLGKKGFWAYCGDESEGKEEVGKGALNAQMILPEGIHLGPVPTGTEGRMKIGLVTVGEANTTNKDYRGIMYVPNSTNITLEANHDYVVTLTPEGYDLNAVVYIAGFPQAEGYVGVPYQLPGKVGDNQYEIKTLAQLVTISWLLSGETLSAEWDTATDWENSTFAIVNPISVSDKIKEKGDKYLKASVLKTNIDKFTGTEEATYSDNKSVFE